MHALAMDPGAGVFIRLLEMGPVMQAEREADAKEVWGVHGLLWTKGGRCCVE